MGLFSRKPKSETDQKAAPATPVKDAPKEIKKEELSKTHGQTYKYLLKPVMTEKSTFLSYNNQYIFEVWQKANKTEIAKAIKKLYKVDVISVKIINIPRKKARLGRTLGWKKGYKKAIVKIKKDQIIEVLPR